MLNLGELVIKVRVDDSGAKSSIRNLDKTVSSSASSMGSSFTNVGNIIKGVLASKYIDKLINKMIDLGKESVELYGEYEQLAGGVEAIFGGYEEGAEQIARVQELSEGAWKSLTLSQNEYYDAFMSSYALVKNDIEDQNVAIERTNDLLQLCSDLSNRFGYQYSEASNAINWALKGSYARLDNLRLGIVGTKKGFLDAAHNCGYLIDSVDELTSDEKIDIITQYAEKYHVMGTTEKEAATTLQGSSKMLKAAWQNLLTAFGKGDPKEIQKNLEELGEAVTTYLQNLGPIVYTIAKSVGKLIIDGITGIDLSDTHHSLAEKLTEAINKLAEELPTLLPKWTKKLVEITNSLLDELIEISKDKETKKKLQEAGINLVKGLVEGMLKSRAIEDEAMPGILKKILTIIMEKHQPEVEAAGGTFIGSYAHGLMLMLEPKMNEFKEKMGKKWDEVKLTVETKIAAMQLKWAVTKFEAKQAIVELKDKLSDKLEPLKKAWNDLKPVLKEKLEPIIDSKPVQLAIKFFKDLFNGINNVRRALGKPIVVEIEYQTREIFDPIINEVPRQIRQGVVNALKHKHRAGLNFVPTNEYPALLHYGEAVLSRGEANEYRKGTLGNIDYNQLALAMADIIPDSIIVQTTVDGKILAQTTAPFMRSAINKIDTRANRQLGLI